MTRSTLALAAGLVAAVVLPPRGAAQQADGAFVTVLGTDTMAVERFTRTADRLEGDLAVRAPRVRLVHYVATLAPDGTIGRFEVSTRPVAPGGPPGPGSAPLEAAIDFGPDTAAVSVKFGDSTRTQQVATARGSVPLISFGYAIYEQVIRQLVASGRDSISVDFLGIGAPEPFTSYAVRRGGDAVAIGFFGDPAIARVEPDGRMLSYDGTATTLKVKVTRIDAVNVAATGEAWGQLEAKGKGVGQLSPRDTVRTTVAGANLMVDYGRPSKRGRTIFGDVVPWDQVWRTGANAATQFTTDRDLMIAGTRVPAGIYTLWTVPSRSGSELVINRQTGQWGTEYDQSQDLARVSLRTSTLKTPVERFTIAVEPERNGGVIRFEWDTLRLTAPFTVAGGGR